jgi:hypothetical protein
MEKKLRTLITQLVNEEISLMEKKRKKDEAPSEENVDIEAAASIEEPSAEETSMEEPSMDVDSTESASTEKRIGKGLQMALDAAKEMPDSENKNKLIRQIGNTALFFMKTQIPGTGDQV